MDFIKIDNLNQLPTKGKVAVFILVEDRAPCKKFLNYSRQALGILENPTSPVGGSYYILPWSNEIKDSLRLNGIPTTIVYVDGVEKKRFYGHYWSQFQTAEMISEGFNK